MLFKRKEEDFASKFKREYPNFYGILPIVKEWDDPEDVNFILALSIIFSMDDNYDYTQGLNMYFRGTKLSKKPQVNMKLYPWFEKTAMHCLQVRYNREGLDLKKYLDALNNYDGQSRIVGVGKD